MSQNQSPEAVPFFDVNRGNHLHRQELLDALAKVIYSGRFLHGPEVTQLEAWTAHQAAAPHAIGCASGSDALLLALMALEIGPGDEVIVPSFTFFATASCVERVGAKIVFADIDPTTYNICPQSVADCITPRTKAIIPVHLFGRCAPMSELREIADHHQIPIIEDAAQAIGAVHAGKPAGAWGEICCFSFYPTKNLGGMGDGGMIVCHDKALADRLRLYAAHGMQPRYYHHVVGINSRLDTFQAAVLLVKAAETGRYAEARRANAWRYRQALATTFASVGVVLPEEDPQGTHVWNQFGIRVPEGRRDALRAYLAERAIGTEIYYPIPLHLQQCFRHLGYSEGMLPHTEAACREILHLPIYPELRLDEHHRVCEGLKSFFQSQSLRRAA